MNKLNERERTSILKTLAMGGVPQLGLRPLAVAREIETKAICQDIDSVVQGGSSFRIFQGDIGCGKTFMQHLARVEALAKNLVVSHIDIGKNHGFWGRNGSSRALISAQMSNLFTKTSSEPGALRRVIETWIATISETVKYGWGDDGQVQAEIVERLRPLKDYEIGQAFSHVLAKYYEGFATDNSEIQDAAIRWLRAEFSTKTEARALLGIRSIIRDEDFYPALKVFALFCRIAGFGGLYIIIDELSGLTEQLANIKAREGNFGTILKMLNESMQGGASSLGFLLGGTNEAIEDQEKGLFSYPPLRSRLKASAPSGEISTYTPLILLKSLGYEHIYELLRRVALVHAAGDAGKLMLPDEGIRFFLEQQIGSSGSPKIANPRDLLRPFVELLARIEQDPSKTWQAYFAKTQVKAA
jgi:hypothetical protein